MMFAKACLVTMAASVASYAAAGSFQQQDGSKHELGAGNKMAAVFPVAEKVGPALDRIAAWATAFSDNFDLPVDFILYVGPKEAQAYDLETRSSSHFALMDKFNINFVVAPEVYQIFIDDSVRQLFDEYEAIAVLDWKNIGVQEDSFARLYHEIFDRARSRRWWVMAADAPPLEAGEAEERGEIIEKLLFGSHGGGGGDGDASLAWNINGNAVVFNNRSRGLRRFFRSEMSPLLRDQPFDLALWATLSFTPPTNRRWGGILLRLVTVDDLIGSPSLAVWEGPKRPIFLDTWNIDWNDSGSDSDSSSSSSSSRVFIDSPRKAQNGGFLRHPPPSDQSSEQQQQREQQLQLQLILEEWLQASEELELRYLEEEGWVRAAEAGAEQRSDAAKNPAPTKLLGKSWLPFTDTLRRGNVCAFIPAYVGQRAFTEATVDSILRLMPGIRIAIATDPSEIEDYQTHVGPLAGVGLTRSVDVYFSAVTADIRCGEGTELILYLEPGTILSRPFTEADTHDSVTGDLLVMYTDATMAGTTRQAAYVSSAEKLLGAHHLPLFSVGTDLLLPPSSNRGLRKILGLSEDRNADWEIHLLSLGRGCRKPEVNAPQVLASATFLASRPGVVFRGVSGGENEHMRGYDTPGVEEKFGGAVDGDEPWQLVLKPRFGCQFYSEVYHLFEGTVPLIIGTDELYFCEGEIQNAAESLRAQLVLFERGEESCASGLIRLPWSSLMDPASGADLVSNQEEDKPSYDYHYSSVSSTTLTSDGARNYHATDLSYDRPDDAGVGTLNGVEGNDGAGLSSFEAGSAYDWYGESGVAVFLQSSRHAIASAAASFAGAGASFPASAAAATNEEHHFHSSSTGNELERHNDEDDSSDEDENSAAANDDLFSAPHAPELDFGDHWAAGAEGYSASGGDGYGYYHAVFSRLSEEARAAAAAAEAAAAASATATAADAELAAAGAADAAAVVSHNSVSSANEANGDHPYMSYNDGNDDGGFFFGKTRWSGFSPGVGDGVGRVALPKN